MFRLHRPTLLMIAAGLASMLGIFASSSVLAAGTATEQSRTTQVACPAGYPSAAVCYQTLSFGQGALAPGLGATAPRVGAARPGSVGALAVPAGATYIYPNVGFQDYYCIGSVCVDGFTIYMTAENWYTGYSVGTVWVNTSCSATLPWTCQAGQHGTFYDSGKGAQTDWDNQNVDYYTVQCTPWLRIWVTATGGVTNAGGGDSCP